MFLIKMNGKETIFSCHLKLENEKRGKRGFDEKIIINERTWV